MAMSLRLLRAAAETENLDDFHLSRLLLLLGAFQGRKKRHSVQGITKLAKLDFLLRYPNCLTRALQAIGKSDDLAQVGEVEASSIEAKMIRFRYGPWDARYRRWIGLLSAKGLVNTYVEGNTVHVVITDKGKEVAGLFAEEDEFKLIAQRSLLIYKNFGDFSATKIKDFIYEVFPEIVTIKWGQEIQL
ncbi:hypothetical protein HH216_25060 (plasmid) [Spirosoma rhododendri]|uniref:Uncharacterized protein n=2 Tax=Spirosoma rhododendri TaxID=2728024 RepID=A0A7L5E1N2_9BACT|nr:hypothetical protein HH216_25060 [Spirosoma rhododendri]